jgi:hypothetical protein
MKKRITVILKNGNVEKYAYKDVVAGGGGIEIVFPYGKMKTSSSTFIQAKDIEKVVME